MKKLVLVTLGAALLLGSTSMTYAAKEGELLVWIGTNRDEAALQTVLDKFTADLGIPAKVEVVDPVPDKFQQAAATAAKALELNDAWADDDAGAQQSA